MRQMDYSRIARHLQSFSPEENEAWNRSEIERATREQDEFRRAFAQGICYLCNELIGSFDEEKPCAHWLLYPTGFKKKHLPMVFRRFGLHQLQSYLRWVASTGTAFRDINDLVDEHGRAKRVDVTIRWGKLEWSFSCSESDMQGHSGKKGGSEPHYHFQMTLDGNVIVKYGEFHPQLNDEDLVILHMTKDHPELFRHQFAFGEGMEALMSEPSQRLLEGALPTDDSETATLHMMTIIRPGASSGNAGEDLQAIVRESRERNVTIASLAHRLGGSALTIVEPGPGVPIARERTPRRKRS